LPSTKLEILEMIEGTEFVVNVPLTTKNS